LGHDLDLQFICSKSDKTEALVDGSVKPAGIRLSATVGASGAEIFSRMLKLEEFDCSEMSFAEAVGVKIGGKRKWDILPVFPARHFFHSDILVNAGSGIKEPRDLEGKKVGLPNYTMSAAIWARGILRDEYDVDMERVQWYAEKFDPKRQEAVGLVIPSQVGISTFSGTTREAVAKGDLDAALVSLSPESSHGGPADHTVASGHLMNLFPDPKLESIRYFKKTGILPDSHLFILKHDVLERHPWVAMNMFKAFQEAKNKAYEKWRELEGWERFSSLLSIVEDLHEQQVVFGDDPFAYGLGPNRKMIETFLRYLHEDGFLHEVPVADELFFETTRGI
jgi:4,5-dihydroxyphthalate decarboxylase